MRTALALAVTCAALAACSSTAVKPTAAPAAAPVAAPSQAAAPAPAPAAESDMQRFDRIVKLLADKSIYFDYDKFSIKPEYQGVLKQDYAALQAAPRGVVLLEGNADERGSAEYNLALGQKRAEAVKQALKILGVPEAHVEAVSYGKEKPRATCHDEKCWAENRRVDVAYKKP